MRHGHDVIIVGAGVIGTAIAFFLAREGVDVGLMDRGGIASGTSGATMGNLSLHNRMPGVTWDLAMASRSLYEQWSDSLPKDFEFEVLSSLMLIDDENAIDWARMRVDVQRAAGLDVEFVDNRRLKEIDSTVAQDLPGAVFCRPSARLNPFLLCQALAESAERFGAHVYRHSEVTGVAVDDASVTGVMTENGRLGCDVLVDAAGPDADHVARMAGTCLPVVRNLGVITVTEPVRYFGIRVKGECTEGARHETSSDELEKRYDVHFVFSQARTGNCLLGRSGEPIDESSPAGVLNASVGVLRRARRFVPALAGVPVIRTFQGIRPYSPDSLPILGALPEPRGFFVACGFGDKGFALGAEGARLVARSIVDDRSRIEEELSPLRFAGATGSMQQGGRCQQGDRCNERSQNGTK